MSSTLWQKTRVQLEASLQPPAWMVGDTESVSLRFVSPPLAYIIATSYRTGSYLLCEGLEESHLAGRPTESLVPKYRSELCQLLYGKPVDFSKSIQALIQQASSPNGVFGTKVHWDQLEEIAYESGYPGEPYVFLLKEFPGARYIYLTREDTLAQAISLYRARETAEWWRIHAVDNGFKKPLQPDFNEEEILRLEQNLLWQGESWESFFTREEIRPLRMTYEALAADYRGEIGRALEFLGQEPTAARFIPEPRLQKQADELSVLWHRWLDPAAKS